MLGSLFVAIISSLLWLNIVFTEITNAKLSSFSEDEKRDKIKLYLILIAAIFWAIVIRYGK